MSRLVRTDDLAWGPSVQARAFVDEPAMVYSFPDQQTRVQKLDWLYSRMWRLWIDKVILVADSERRGLATLYPPDANPVYSLRHQLAIGLLAAPFRIGPLCTRRLVKVAGWVDRMHARVRTEPHWYLDYVGVLPEARGRGIGTQLLVDRLRLIDDTGLPSYVMTFQPALPPRYAGHGFVTLVEEPVTRGGPTGWLLQRPGRGG